ncbi:MAG: 2-C-methyl-D-erythritol 4-phosphate cytidylyltransferase [Dysgonamonadaceae bacterium]|jgi:2-C-methyl-D-erythritol 4-phosphate cytidylyltransferase|nr:2-C-methyl-D-erythritol 4-phosphate cytidylyltransferase [Dysgonamonadaceae bacterium]
MTAAIILAGGTGERIGGALPKQFLMMGGKTVLEHSVCVFEKNSAVDEITIVVHPHYIGRIEAMIASNGWRKIVKILAGGSERYESSFAAVQEYASLPNCRMLIHDAVRPLVSQRIINEVIEALEIYNAVNVTIPVTDTIIRMDESGRFVSDIPDRRRFHRGQSPQGFRCQVLEKAYRIAFNDPSFSVTDDCGVVARYLPCEKIFTVVGEESNMKLTYREDIGLLERYLAERGI